MYKLPKKFNGDISMVPSDFLKIQSAKFRSESLKPENKQKATKASTNLWTLIKLKFSN